MKRERAIIAKIENEFVLKAHYALSAVEQKLIVYLVSRINPQDEDSFQKQIVPIKDLEKLFASSEKKKWGNIYSYLEDMCDNLLGQIIRFREPIMINEEERIIKGGINWFQHILIVENKKGQKSIEFMFSDMMRPFLLELKRYVRISALEVMELKSKYAIRMYQVFKTERERTKKHKNASIITYTVEELKAFLGIPEKYPVLSNFRRRVLEVIEQDINAYSQEIVVKIEYVREGRKVTKIQFIITDKVSKKAISKTPEYTDYVPSDEDIAILTNAKFLALKALVDYGVKPGIAYKRILPSIMAGDIEGFEDIFIQQALIFFGTHTNQKNATAKAGSFVIWWTEKQVFSHEGDVYWKLHEKVYNYKKSLNEERRENRELAKKLPRATFLAKVREGKE